MEEHFCPKIRSIFSIMVCFFILNHIRLLITLSIRSIVLLLFSMCAHVLVLINILNVRINQVINSKIDWCLLASTIRIYKLLHIQRYKHLSYRPLREFPNKASITQQRHLLSSRLQQHSSRRHFARTNSLVAQYFRVTCVIHIHRTECS